MIGVFGQISETVNFDEKDCMSVTVSGPGQYIHPFPCAAGHLILCQACDCLQRLSQNLLIFIPEYHLFISSPSPPPCVRLLLSVGFYQPKQQLKNKSSICRGKMSFAAETKKNCNIVIDLVVSPLVEPG